MTPRACNADTLKTHVASLEKIIGDFKITADHHVHKLEETGDSPSRDNGGRTLEKHLLCGTSKYSQIREATLSCFRRVTILSTACAEGNECILMLVIRGSDIPYHTDDKSNTWEHE